MKTVKKSIHPHELEITQYLNSPELLADPRNRCTRILDILEVPGSEGEEVLLVMPMLRAWYEPALRTVGEAVYFCTQIVEVSSLVVHLL